MKTLLADSILNLCKSSLQFSSELSVEALVGVTLDKQNILLMNINKSISCDAPVSVRKEKEPQASPSKRRKKGGSPNKRKSSNNGAPPNKVAPPPNQSLDLYHRPWDQEALAPNVTIKSEPVDNAPGKEPSNQLPHSELRAHLESGVGSRMAGQQAAAPAVSGALVNGMNSNAVNGISATSTLPFPSSTAPSGNGNQGSSLNTRSALYQVTVGLFLHAFSCKFFNTQDAIRVIH